MLNQNIVDAFRTSKNDKKLEKDGTTYFRFKSEADHGLIIDYVKKESLSVQLLALQARYSGTQNGNDMLRRTAELICERITYLSENFKLIELDRQNNRIQIRSAPPYRKDSVIYFFEIILDFSSMTLTLQRLLHEREDRSTRPVPFVASYDILERLLYDLLNLSET